MRIAAVNSSGREVGGAETYLSTILPELQGRGHEIAFWYERNDGSERREIAPPGTTTWCAADLGVAGALEALRAWRPDVVYVHAVSDPRTEAALLDVAPAVLFAHNYYGTCISGGKTVTRPAVAPCDRRFGAACLAHYFPSRCGGRSPLTMLSEFRIQSQRLGLLPRYGAILCASRHMQREFVRHDLPEALVRLVPLPIAAASARAAAVAEAGRATPGPGEPWRIVMAARMEAAKGGTTLLTAIPMVRAALDRPIHVVFAGDGRERAMLESRAANIRSPEGGIEIEFEGWLGAEQLELLIQGSHVLVVPSVWPEPFGMIGLEAGRLGVPSAAFAVGGIPDWLEDGRNGALAPATPPTAEGLAAAIVRCLDPERYPSLRANAVAAAARFSLAAHLDRLERVFAAVSGRDRVPEPASR